MQSALPEAKDAKTPWQRPKVEGHDITEGLKSNGFVTSAEFQQQCGRLFNTIFANDAYDVFSGCLSAVGNYFSNLALKRSM